MKSFKQYLLLERNIFNVDKINLSLENFIKRKNITNQNIIKWIKSNLRNYIINDYKGILPETYFKLTKDSFTYSKNNSEWLKKALEKGESVYLVNINDLEIFFNSNIAHVIDYFNANPNLRIERISVPEAIRQSEQWTKQLTKKKLTDEDPQGIKTIKKMSNGFKWVEVISQQSLDREGKLMNHCVGSYYDQVKIGKVTIYSLRDSKNMPHCTIEAKGRSIHQIKGNSNGPIKEQFIPYVVNFINDFKIENEYDLINLNLIMIDGKIYDINNLPNRIKGSLNLSGTKITKLPDNLHVSGYLNLSGINITKLPDNLHVGGNLYLSYTKISKLPDKLYVGRNLDLSGTKITKLPDNLHVGGNLDLSHTNITKLPNDLHVSGYLNLSDTNITKLPDNLHVSGYLNLSDTNITKLPNDLHVDGSLGLFKTKVSKLPDNLHVGRNLYLSDTKVNELPDDLEVKGRIYINKGQLKFIQDKFKNKTE